MLYEILKTSKLGASFAPDMYTALWAQKLARDGEVKTLSGIPPLTFRSNGQPLLDYLISGNTVQNGTPTSDSLIMPQGTGDKTANLFDVSSVIYGTWTDNSGRAQSYGYGARSIDIPSSQITVSFNGFVFPYSYSIVFLNSNDEFIIRYHKSTTSQIREPQTFTPPNTATKFYIQLANGTDETYPITKEQIESYKLMLNTGSTALPYEPYGYKIPISSASTTTPIYLGEVETTRKVKKLVLDGTENLTISNSCFILCLYSVHYPDPKQELIYCTHYKGRTPTYRDSLANGQCMITINQNQIAIKDLAYATVDDFKSYLAAQYAAGTPVTVWYVLATEQIGVVNETLQKIGDYADSISMEQAGVEIPTARGTNTLDVLTDVKPSEIYIKYKS